MQMNTRLLIWRNATIVGIIPALLEGLLVYSVEPAIDRWHLTQAVLFWFTCGFVVYLADLGLPVIANSVLLTVFLNLPWYIAEAILPQKYEHLLPLLIASIVAGAIIGLATQQLKKPRVSQRRVTETMGM